MENASKALLMAGGMLMAMMVIALLLVMFNSISNYFNGDIQAQREAQIVKFNLEYESYNRDDVRGTEILSLLAKANDYNTKQSDYEGTAAGYNPITVEINLNKNNFIERIKFNKNDNSIFTNKTKLESNDYNFFYKKRNGSNGWIEKINNMKNSQVKGNITETDLETLIGAIDSINDYENLNATNKEKIKSLIYRIFKINEEGFDIWKSKNFEKLKNVLKESYQYTQFKKAHFDCIEVSYKDNTEKDTSRITKLKFEFNEKIE